MYSLACTVHVHLPLNLQGRYKIWWFVKKPSEALISKHLFIQDPKGVFIRIREFLIWFWKNENEQNKHRVNRWIGVVLYLRI